MSVATQMPVFDPPEARGLVLPLGRLRGMFPGLKQDVHDHPLTWLDNAATTQKPATVIDAMSDHLRRNDANVHRGVHLLSQRATEAFEGARRKVGRFVNASPEEIVFVRGATEAVNLVAGSWGRAVLKADDEVLITEMEHHANIVPWQLLRDQMGIRIRVLPMDDRGDLRMDLLPDFLTERTSLVAVTQMSNALGTLNPVEEIVAAAHARGIPVLVDGAQGVAHVPVDVRAMACDFYVFSGHKVFGPPGIGVLYGRKEILERMPPWQGGGDMVLQVDFDHTIYQRPPHRFEAGTPNTVGAVGLGVALDFLADMDRGAIARHEAELLTHATEMLQEFEGLRILGEARRKGPVISFVFDDLHPHDIGTLLDEMGVAVRSGHHCAQPTMRHFGVPASTRVSFALYNDHLDIDRLALGLRHVLRVLR